VVELAEFFRAVCRAGKELSRLALDDVLKEQRGSMRAAGVTRAEQIFKIETKILQLPDNDFCLITKRRLSLSKKSS
jgi:hypothetical protein